MSKWQEILDKSKKEEAGLQIQAKQIQDKLYRLSLTIFEAEVALEKEKKNEKK